MRIGFILLLNLFTAATYAFSVTDLEAQRLKFGAPGAGAGLITSKSIDVWTTGVRKAGSSVQIENSDKFHLGSNTKAMTATLLAQMIESGLVRWETTLQEIFPDLALRAEFLNVTLEMLTAHRSGITSDMTMVENGELWSWMWQNNSSTELSQRYTIAQRILAFPAQKKPGSTYIYSNWNYIIVGAVLEKLSGKSWEILLQEKIFSPLKMSSCGFGAAARVQLETPDQPWPHVLRNGSFVAVPATEAHDNPRGLGPAGKVHCSLGDWGRFLKAHIDGFQNRNTPILQAASYQRLHTSYPGQEYTPGGWLRFTHKNHPVLQHTGSNTMNYANVWLLPADEIGMMAVVNAADPAREVFSLTDGIIAELMKDAVSF